MFQEQKTGTTEFSLQSREEMNIVSNVLPPETNDGKLGGRWKLDPVSANTNLLANWKKIDQRRMLFDSSLECSLLLVKEGDDHERL